MQADTEHNGPVLAIKPKDERLILTFRRTFPIHNGPVLRPIAISDGDSVLSSDTPDPVTTIDNREPHHKWPQYFQAAYRLEPHDWATQ